MNIPSKMRPTYALDSISTEFNYFNSSNEFFYKRFTAVVDGL